MSGLRKDEVSQRIDAWGISPKRSLGQNFLIDPIYAAMISDAVLSVADSVFEIGPGLGSLTFHLAKAGARIVAVEKDEFVAQSLEDMLRNKSVQNVDLIIGDALEYDFENASISTGISCIAGNLPYNISVPLILGLIERAPSITSMIFLVQSEVAHRLGAIPGSRASSYTSLKTSFYCETKILFDIPNVAFSPIPNVNSTLIEFQRSNLWTSRYDQISLDTALELARIAFGHRRQMLRRSFFNEDLKLAMARLNISETRRPENLKTDEWAELGKQISTAGLDLSTVLRR